MSSVASLQQRMKQGTPLLTAWCGLPDPAIAGLLAYEDFDAVTVDLQHGAVDYAGAVRAIPLIAAAGKPAIVRVPVGEFTTASRLLDAGAAAIIAPMINNVEDARRFAAFAKFPPGGERSWGPNAALTLTGLAGPDYFARANDFCLTFAMIETREALAAMDDIMAVPGIDAVFIGPSDLSIALSGGGQPNPGSAAVEEALAHAHRRARAAGKFIGVYASNPELAARFTAEKFDLIAAGSDYSLLRAGARAALATARA